MTTAPALDPLFDPAVVQDPYDYYRQLRLNEPVHENPGTDTYLATSAELLRDIVADPEIYSSDTSLSLHKGDWDQPGLRAPVARDVHRVGWCWPPQTRRRTRGTERSSAANSRPATCRFRGSLA